MKKLRLAIVQHRATSTNPAENAALAISWMEQAKKNGVDLVLFPECFLSTYAPPAVCRTLKPFEEIKCHPSFLAWYKNALTEESAALQSIREAAAALQIGAVITGFTRGNERPRNSAFLIDRNGHILLKYDKVHTCDFDWEQYLESGDGFYVCMFEGIRIGIMICYDREHPESARELMLQGAELILVPNDCDAMAPRLQELSVAAMQNMVGVAMANPPGKSAGNSCAYDPRVWDDNGCVIDNTIALAEAEFDGILYAEFDMEAIRHYRDNEFLGKNRKPAAYHHLTKL